MEPLKQTKFNGFTTKNGNYVWAGALGLAWNQLIHDFIKEPIQVATNDIEVQQIVHNFNNCKFSASDIDQKSYYIKSGYGIQTVKAINEECKKKFPQKTFDDLKLNLGTTDIIAYAYLFKQLLYKIPFTRNQQNNFLFEGQNVPSFKADNIDQKKQFNCIYYENQDKFMVYITGADNKDILYLIKDKTLQTVQDAINSVVGNQGKMSKKLGAIDEFQMPIVDLDIRRNLTELEKKSIENKNFFGYQFDSIQQGIRLKIDQFGAKVENEGVFSMVGCCMSNQVPTPKLIYLDKEFWIVMKEYWKHPYLAVKIKNPTDK